MPLDMPALSPEQVTSLSRGRLLARLSQREMHHLNTLLPCWTLMGTMALNMMAMAFLAVPAYQQEAMADPAYQQEAMQDTGPTTARGLLRLMLRLIPCTTTPPTATPTSTGLTLPLDMPAPSLEQVTSLSPVCTRERPRTSELLVSQFSNQVHQLLSP